MPLTVVFAMIYSVIVHTKLQDCSFNFNMPLQA